MIDSAINILAYIFIVIGIAVLIWTVYSAILFLLSKLEHKKRLQKWLNDNGYPKGL